MYINLIYTNIIKITLTFVYEEPMVWNYDINSLYYFWSHLMFMLNFCCRELEHFSESNWHLLKCLSFCGNWREEEVKCYSGRKWPLSAADWILTFTTCVKLHKIKPQNCGLESFASWDYFRTASQKSQNKAFFTSTKCNLTILSCLFKKKKSFSKPRGLYKRCSVTTEQEVLFLLHLLKVFQILPRNQGVRVQIQEVSSSCVGDRKKQEKYTGIHHLPCWWDISQRSTESRTTDNWKDLDTDS